MNTDRNIIKQSKEKKILSQNNRNNSAINIGRKKQNDSLKITKQPLTQLQKSIVNSVEARAKTNGSECSSAKKNRKQNKDAGFKTLKNKVTGYNKENVKNSTTFSIHK
jgi:hypothetical protein